MTRPPPTSTLFPYTTLFRSLQRIRRLRETGEGGTPREVPAELALFLASDDSRSEEHTSELQSLTNLVCRLLLEKKKNLERTKYIDTERVADAQERFQGTRQR